MTRHPGPLPGDAYLAQLLGWSEDQLLQYQIERREIITVTLTSPLDALRGDAPRRRLTTELVGQVPSTGQIFIA